MKKRLLGVLVSAAIGDDIVVRSSTNNEHRHRRRRSLVRADDPIVIPLPAELLPRHNDNINNINNNNNNINNNSILYSIENKNYDNAADLQPNNLQLLRIINGQPTIQERHPYIASLLDTSTMSHVCGGTLIAPDIILTAGHCSGFFDAIQVGLHDLTDQSGTYDTYDHLLVEEHRVHPRFGNIIMNDFALAKLYGSTVSGVSPIRINKSQAIPNVDDTLSVLGWGVTEVTADGIAIEGTSPNVLHSINVTAITNDECNESSGIWKGNSVSYSGHITDNMICAWSNDQDACKGDSGGPMIRAGESVIDDVQIGIISWGLGCALDSFPGVYGRISLEYDWIVQNVCEMSKSPPSYFGCYDGMTSTSDVDSEVEVGEFKIVTRDVELIDVTIAIELDSFPEETSFVLEVDPDIAKSVAWLSQPIEGKSHVPLKTYTSQPLKAVAHSVKVAQDTLYRLTILDSGSDGIQQRSRDGDESNFRMCYGTISAEECLNAPVDSSSDIVICYGSGDFELARSLSCQVNKIDRPPTFAPFAIDLDIFLDDYVRTDSPTPIPTIATVTWPPTITPAPSPIDDNKNDFSNDGSLAPTKAVPTDFLSGSTFVTDGIENPAQTPSDGDTSATDDTGDNTRSNSFKKRMFTTSLAVLVISAAFFVM